MTPATAPEKRPKVAVIGLGRMGSAIAQRLSQRFDVSGWDVRPIELQGVETGTSLDKVINDAAVIIASLPSVKENRAVLTDPAFQPSFQATEAVFLDASTSAPSEIKALALELGAAGNRLLDAPILGRPESVGSWTMPVGGSAASFEAARPVLETLASRVFHVGSLGSAHTIKLLNNMMFAAINVITAEAIGSCDWLGIDPAQFVDIVGGSTAATVSPLFRSLAPRMVGESLDTVFTVRLLDKDLRLAVEMCLAANVPLVSAPALRQVTREALERGLADRDTAALVELYRQKDRHGP